MFINFDTNAFLDELNKTQKICIAKQCQLPIFPLNNQELEESRHTYHQSFMQSGIIYERVNKCYEQQKKCIDDMLEKIGVSLSNQSLSIQLCQLKQQIFKQLKQNKINGFDNMIETVYHNLMNSQLLKISGSKIKILIEFIQQENFEKFIFILNQSILQKSLQILRKAIPQYSQKIQKFLTLINNLIQFYPKSAILHHQKGLIFGTVKLNHDSYNQFTLAIQLNNNYCPSYFNRAMILQQQGKSLQIKNAFPMKKYKAALQDLTNALKFNEKFKQGLFHRGKLYAKINKIKQAKTDFIKLIELDPEFYLAYFNLAQIYENQAKFYHAEKNYTKSIQKNPNFSEGYFKRGLFYKNTHQFQEAMLDLNKFIELNSQNAEGYFERAGIFQIQQKYKECIFDYKKCIQLDPWNPKLSKAILYIGIYYDYIEQVEIAEQIYIESYYISTDSPVTNLKKVHKILRNLKENNIQMIMN